MTRTREMSTKVESPTGSSNTLVSAMAGAGAKTKTRPSVHVDRQRIDHLVASMPIPVPDDDLLASWSRLSTEASRRAHRRQERSRQDRMVAAHAICGEIPVEV